MNITTRNLLKQWFRQGLAQNKKWMIVVCDGFDNEDYPVFAETDDEFWELNTKYDNVNMQRIMESYDLTKDMNEQLDYERSHNTPIKKI